MAPKCSILSLSTLSAKPYLELERWRLPFSFWLTVSDPAELASKYKKHPSIC